MMVPLKGWQLYLYRLFDNGLFTVIFAVITFPFCLWLRFEENTDTPLGVWALTVVGFFLILGFFNIDHDDDWDEIR